MRTRAALSLLLTTVVLLTGIGLFREGRVRRAEHDRFAFLMDSFRIMPAGSPFPATSVKTSSSHQVIDRLLHGSWTLVLVTATYDEDQLAYPRVLTDAYANRGLHVVNVLPPSRDNERLVQSTVPSSRIILATDTSRALARRLQLPQDGTLYAWTLLSDPTGRVVFSFPGLVAPDDLRQLVHRHVGPAAGVRTSGDEGFDAGAELPSVEIVSLQQPETTLRLQELLTPGGTIIFFRAQCTSCGVGNLLPHLATLENAGIDFAADRIVPIFSHSFGQTALSSAATGRSLPELYIAKGLVKQWEDPYLTRADVLTEPKVIHVDARNRIVKAENFYSWMLAVTQRSSGSSEGRGWSVIGGTGGLDLGWVTGIAPLGDEGLAILDSKNHRILAVDRAGNNVSVISGIGQGAADLFHPLALSTGAGVLTIADQHGQMVKTMSLEGIATGDYVFSGVTDSIAVFDDGTIYANSPRDGALAITVGNTGTNQHIGQLASVGQVYEGRSDIEVAFPFGGDMRIPLNRAWLAAADGGRLVMAFQFLPLVRCYGRDGGLLWQTRLRGEDIEALAATFWKEPGAAKALSVKNMDGIQLPMFITAISIDRTGRTWIALANGAVVILDPEGRTIGSAPPPVTRSLRGPVRAMLVRQKDVVLCGSTRCLSGSTNIFAEYIPRLADVSTQAESSGEKVSLSKEGR